MQQKQDCWNGGVLSLRRDVTVVLICKKMICWNGGGLSLRRCNVPDLASLGNVANVCVGSKVYNI
jgi:hypothetical protein